LSSSCVLCTQCCQCLLIFHFRMPLPCSLTFIYSFLKNAAYDLLYKNLCYLIFINISYQ
jgi:hypothetical protein